uniref:RSD-2 domain-containing protein n=1 Tax=Caenorhabditis japonica TaxID=281687 RepID=A0A8R1DEL1_CAEJA
MSQSQGSKKELELSALVLDPCPKMGSKEIICYETNQLRLLRVNWTDQADDDIHRYDTLQFITDGDDGVQCIVKPGTTPRITSPPANGLVLRPDRSVKIEAYVAFSSDRDHLSHNKSVAVSDQYGYIQLPPDCDKDRQYWEEQTIYKVEIVISQFTDPVQPIFKVVSPLVTKFQRTQAADEMFFSTIRKFENQYAKNFRENHLGSTHAPRGTSLKERKAETRNIKPGARRLTRDEVKQRVDAVVLHLQPQYGGVCGVVSTPLGEADLTTMTITGAEREEDSEAGQAVRVGDWIKVKLEYREKQRHLFASKIMSRERIPLVLRMVNDEFGQIQVLHGPFNKNSLRYDHHEQGIRYYKHPRLGHVEVDATFYNDEASVFDVEYRRVRRPTEQIVGNASIWVYWYISKRLEDVEQPSQQSGPRGQQQVHGCAASSSSSDISPVIREADNMSTRGSSYASVPPASRPDSMMGSIGEGFRQQS